MIIYSLRLAKTINTANSSAATGEAIRYLHGTAQDIISSSKSLDEINQKLKDAVEQFGAFSAKLVDEENNELLSYTDKAAHVLIERQKVVM